MPVTTRAGSTSGGGSAGEGSRKGNGGSGEGKKNAPPANGEKDDKQNGALGKRKRSDSESSSSDVVSETIGPPSKITNTASRSAVTGSSLAVSGARGSSNKAASLMMSSNPQAAVSTTSRDDPVSTALAGRQLVNSISKRIDAEVKLLLVDTVPRTIDELNVLLQSADFDPLTLAERALQDEFNQERNTVGDLSGLVDFSSTSPLEQVLGALTTRLNTNGQANVSPPADAVSNNEETQISRVHQLILSQQQIVARLLDDLIERTIKLQTWITSHFPRIVDGQQIGVITRALAQVAAEEAKNFAQRTQEEMKDYESDYQICVSAAREHPHVADAHLNVIDCNEREFYAMRHAVDEVRSFYVYMHRVISCNRERLQQSEETTEHNYMFM